MRGLVLAAGLGTRLRPLTDDVPKPLLPVVARPMIEHALALLYSAGLLDVAVNAHHRADLVADYFRYGSCFWQRVTMSREEPDVLGTGGAIKRLHAWLEGSDPFVVTNGDTISKPDLNVALDAHKKSGALATMILRRDERAERYGVVATDADGAVVDVAGLAGKSGSDGGLFIGTSILSSAIFNHMPDEDIFCVIRKVYAPLLRVRPEPCARSTRTRRFSISARRRITPTLNSRCSRTQTFAAFFRTRSSVWSSWSRASLYHRQPRSPRT
ncbi:MAG: nucleotidyltransferase family protein [Deltaproteobacteria bacterium]|nr:nucleotidyltransferase family protein [Deltaproteobacteria bacterium]